MVTLGVISDTHVPDRTRKLNPAVLRHFKQAEVSAILHAGDILAPRVLDQLGEVAPVFAVRGNRDWLWLRQLPKTRLLEFAGVTIALTHGHGQVGRYLIDRFYFLLNGYQPERLLPRLLATFPLARVIVFGHGHEPLNQWLNGQLIFNPGAAFLSNRAELNPSIGLLHISQGGQVQGEIIEL